MSERIVIAGAGPVGCCCALVLARAGIPVLLLEAETTLPLDLRASTFHPPTLDMLAKIDLTQKLLPLGLIATRYQYRDRASGLYAEFNLDVLEGLVDHPFRLQCEQFKLTQTVVDMLAAYPHAEVRMGAKVTAAEQKGRGVDVTITDASGGAERIAARFLVGCDGARSQVRKSAGIEFEGFTYPELFLVVSTTYPLQNHLANLADVNYVSAETEWCTILRVPSAWRVLFPAPVEATPESLTDPASLQPRLQRLAPHDGEFDILHVSLYRVHQRVAKHYRVGSVLVAGDAAHVNNPLGGMGMNGGIHDAFNLAEKLIAIVRDGAGDDLLDLYERQRRTVTVEYIQAQTIQNKKNIEEADEARRMQRIHDLRAVAADRQQAIAFLRRNNMIDALERSHAIS